MRRLKSRHLLAPLLTVLLLASYSGFVWFNTPALRLLPTSTLAVTETPAKGATMNWPTYGQAAVGALNYGLLGSKGNQTPLPTASTIKIMTAYAILQTKPLDLGQQTTPVITITQADVDIYNAYIAKGGSVALVAAGTQLTEYQALQALLLPSANNIADSLTAWAFGSEANYLSYANKQAKALGMTNTTIADASGFSPQTVSTAEDLVKLTLVALKNPVFAQIVGQSKATIPIAGIIYNINGLLGRDNIIGVKTGSTDQAGGCFVGAATQIVNNKAITVVTAIMGGPYLDRSMLDTLPLLASAKQNFAVQTSLLKGTEIGYYESAWGGRTTIVAAENASFVGWKGSAESRKITLTPLRAPQKQGANAGSITITAPGVKKDVPLVTSEALDKPTFLWRLRHPF